MHDMIVDFRIITLETIFHISFKKLSTMYQSLLSFFVKKSCCSSSSFCVNVTEVDGSFGGRNSIRGPIFSAVELKSHQQHIVRPGTTLTHDVRPTLPRVSF